MRIKDKLQNRKKKNKCFYCKNDIDSDLSIRTVCTKCYVKEVQKEENNNLEKKEMLLKQWTFGREPFPIPLRLWQERHRDNWPICLHYSDELTREQSNNLFSKEKAMEIKMTRSKFDDWIKRKNLEEKEISDITWEEKKHHLVLNIVDRSPESKK